MQRREDLQAELAKLIATRVVNDREMVVAFLRSRTKYEVPETCSNGYLASILSDMVFDEKGHEKLGRLLMKEVEFVNFDPLSLTAIMLYLAIVGTGATVTAAVRSSQEARESAISGLTQQQVQYDKQILEDREKRQGEFLAQVIAEEKKIQEEKRALVNDERRQMIIYLSIFIAVLTIAFGLILNKK